ncbi:mitochondrial enolase superfamily member 1-like isoform X2 [Acanthaster planci]|uniref:Mitochondrial enolase superfamily member 1 n=1 Tax=Acanthaster planci TaxID=133434 RepID=A0A8B7YG60_ACAPL|nr:mitochondrial enolase superfamily member 1-like isoform X2 [Acanthaster planci]
MAAPICVTNVEVKDVRFPTSLEQHGSDAMHTDPDYSCAYVIITTNDADNELTGHGLTFTIGRGTEIVVAAVKALAPFVTGKALSDIYDNFANFYRMLTSEPQLRWVGPEKGVIHLATAAILNALWDLWAKREGKPVWKLLADMEPEQIVNCIDFRYITDALTKEEALEILRSNQATKREREQTLLKDGYPAYTTSTAWLGYSDEVLLQRCRKALSEGWTKFKMKVGSDLADDIHRAELLRNEIGYDKILMMDANQKWGVDETIEWMGKLAMFKPLWIEEPTSPDDILGHAKIVQAMKPLGIGVATGEHCQNRVMFKQFLQAGALQYCQIDSCRVGSINELLSIILMAKKFGVPVCPHAGGVSLCELVQHVIMFDYLCVSATLENRVLEYVDHLHEHAKYPIVMKDTCYTPPKEPGYSTELKEQTLADYAYPAGRVWQDLAREGKVTL